jgi:phage terminase large subunit
MVFPVGHDKEGEPLFYRRFIPASLKDNPYLMRDGQYEANLLALPEMQRRQLLEGDWAVADGAAFPEFKQTTHVCEPFDIPDDWRRFRSCDYGYSSYSAVHWFAIDPSYETLYVYRELYVSKHTGKDLGRAVMEAEQGESIHYGVLDSSCWHNRGQIGPSIAEEMISMGCRWRPSDRSAGARVSGKNRFHEVLKVNEETETAGIVFFNTCRQIIADLPIIPSDPKGSDDIDPRYATDHAYDSVRYGIMSRPKAFSPFDTGRGVPIQHYKPSDSTFGY